MHSIVIIPGIISTAADESEKSDLAVTLHRRLTALRIVSLKWFVVVGWLFWIFLDFIDSSLEIRKLSLRTTSRLRKL